MVRIQLAAEIHERPDLDAAVVGNVEAGQTAEVIQQLTDGLGLEWVRISQGWVCCIPNDSDSDGDEEEDDNGIDVDEVSGRHDGGLN